MIQDEKKEEVRQASDIVEVVSDYVKLKRSGNNFTGLCPFHNEKTPSFSVSPGLGIFKCFGCGEGGDVFNFVMKIDGVGFEEAVRTLADRYNVRIPEKEQEEYDPQQYLKDGIYHALRFAGSFFHQTLADSDEAEKARKYLDQRGYPWKTIRRYGLGFASDRKNALLKAADSAGINLQYLHESGLVKSREDSSDYFDTFRNRLMFPIFSPSGKVIAFGGRTLSEGKKVPKYINSPQTPVYNKSEVLYGIQVAKNEIRKAGEVILVEGYTDVLSMHQAGIGNVVSTSGTSLTQGQMRIMKRYGDSMLMIFDADTAGMKAAVRGITIALEEGMGVRILTLPEGEDPDSYVRQYGMEGFVDYKKKQTRDFLRFLVSVSKEEKRWDDPVERKKVMGEILEVIAVIPDELSRENYIQELSGISKIGDRALMKELNVIRSRLKKQSRIRSGRTAARETSGTLRRDVAAEHRPTREPSSHDTASHGSAKAGAEPYGNLSGRDPHGDDPRSSALDKKDSLRRSGDSLPGASRPVRRPGYEKELIRLMLTFGKKIILFVGSHCNEDQFEDPELRSFYKDIMTRYQQGDPVSIESYSEREHPFPQLMSEIILERHSISELGMKKRGIAINRDADPINIARGALKSLKLRFLEQSREKLLENYRVATTEDKEKIQKWIKQVSIEHNRYFRESLKNLFPVFEQEEDTSSDTEGDNI